MFHQNLVSDNFEEPRYPFRQPDRARASVSWWEEEEEEEEGEQGYG
jgi:hypothetical protein